MFDDKAALERFKEGRFDLSVDGSGVLIASGYAASVSLIDGVTVFWRPLGGLMAEATVWASDSRSSRGDASATSRYPLGARRASGRAALRRSALLPFCQRAARPPRAPFFLTGLGREHLPPSRGRRVRAGARRPQVELHVLARSLIPGVVFPSSRGGASPRCARAGRTTSRRPIRSCRRGSPGRGRGTRSRCRLRSPRRSSSPCPRARRWRARWAASRIAWRRAGPVRRARSATASRRSPRPPGRDGRGRRRRGTRRRTDRARRGRRDGEEALGLGIPRSQHDELHVPRENPVERASEHVHALLRGQTGDQREDGDGRAYRQPRLPLERRLALRPCPRDRPHRNARRGVGRWRGSTPPRRCRS